MIAPTSCGVYIFKDEKGNPVYVGKAKNIRERLKAYFELHDTRPQVPKIIEEAKNVEWILTKTEEEALDLEDSLIKRLKPKYNVKLKDSKTYPYVKISISEEFPAILYARNPKKDASLYFGPFFSSKQAKDIIETLKRVFLIRSCNNTKFKEFKKRERACLDGQINICSAPCISPERDRYIKNVWRCAEFLRGRGENIITQLERKMWKQAESENFEEAVVLRDRIKSLEKLLASQRRFFEDLRDVDFLGIERGFLRIAIFLIRVRGGRLQGGEGEIFRDAGQDEGEFISSFVRSKGLSGKIVVRKIPEWKVKGVNFSEPSDEAEEEVIRTAERNAVELITSRDEKARILKRLMDIMFLKSLPRTIEVFDFSHFSGKNPVGFKVRFEDGFLVEDGMRRYKIETGADDYYALREVLGRRIKRGLEEEGLPDLFVIDGGKAHLSTALSVLESFNIKKDIICIAKGHKAGKRREREISVWVPGLPKPLKPPKDALEFLLRIRDSAHKRAKKYQHKREASSLR